MATTKQKRKEEEEPVVAKEAVVVRIAQGPKQTTEGVLGIIGSKIRDTLNDIKEGKGRGLPFTMDQLLAAGTKREERPTVVKREQELGAVVVKRENLDLKVTPTAVAAALQLKKALDEAARHAESEQISWGS